MRSLGSQFNVVTQRHDDCANGAQGERRYINELKHLTFNNLIDNNKLNMACLSSFNFAYCTPEQRHQALGKYKERNAQAELRRGCG
jgi:hypothetical protein